MQGSPFLKQCLHGGNVMQHFRQIVKLPFRKALDFRKEVLDFGSAGNQAMRTFFFLFRALIIEIMSPKKSSPKVGLLEK